MMQRPKYPPLSEDLYERALVVVGFIQIQLSEHRLHITDSLALLITCL